ncbi:hypothetical protein F5Y15DRAFT_172238 [Xylariaceae sp. FL0016]|nr:hypothetical protein F5Y15DRAFT_172238 [Xylariaceae sp. FL0016]
MASSDPIPDFVVRQIQFHGDQFNRVEGRGSPYQYHVKFIHQAESPSESSDENEKRCHSIRSDEVGVKLVDVFKRTVNTMNSPKNPCPMSFDWNWGVVKLTAIPSRALPQVPVPEYHPALIIQVNNDRYPWRPGDFIYLFQYPLTRAWARSLCKYKINPANVTFLFRCCAFLPDTGEIFDHHPVMVKDMDPEPGFTGTDNVMVGGESENRAIFREERSRLLEPCWVCNSRDRDECKHNFVFGDLTTCAAAYPYLLVECRSRRQDST